MIAGFTIGQGIQRDSKPDRGACIEQAPICKPSCIICFPPMRAETASPFPRQAKGQILCTVKGTNISEIYLDVHFHSAHWYNEKFNIIFETPTTPAGHFAKISNSFALVLHDHEIWRSKSKCILINM